MPASHLVLIGSGGQDGAMREFVMSRIAATHTVALVDTAVPAWANRYVAAHIKVADLSDTSAVATAVKEHATEYEVAGVMTYMEHHVVTAAVVATALGLPSSPPEAVAACRDKAATRRILDDNRVPSARAREVSDAEEAVAYADFLGYPVMIKPRAQAASAGVVRADKASDVRAAYNRASQESVGDLHRYGPQGVLVEEYLDGPEISVETAVLGPGQARVLAITRKEPSPDGTTQESGHIVDAADPLLHDEALTEVVEGAVTALGLTCGVLCVEVMLTQTGPRIVEVNARLGGDLLPLLVHHALGLDLAQIAAALAVGRQPELDPTERAAAGIRFAYPAASGLVERLAFPPGLDKLPPVERAVVTRKLGAHVVAPPRCTLADRLAHWVVLGQSAHACQTLLDEVACHLDVSITAPTHVTSCSR